MTQTIDNAYAVIIGVDANEIGRLALPTVAKDVQAVYDVLIHPDRCGYKPDNVKFYRGTEATKDNIFNAFFWLQDKLKEDADATAIVYYSGHGMFDKRANQYYLIPYDIGEMRRIRQKAIKADELGAEIAALQPQRLLVILDCCHADGMGIKDVDIDGPIPAAFPLDLPETKDIPDLEQGGKSVNLLAEGNGRAILNSSTGAQSSYIRRGGEMSLFTYHLIEALTGHAPHNEDDKTVLVTDVMSYVTRKVAETARAEGRQQTPVMKTTGVFPVALLLGGEGTKGIDVDALPDPLGASPAVSADKPVASIKFNQQGQVVYGSVYNADRDINIGQIGNTVHTTVQGDQTNTGGGSYSGGESNTVGTISGGTSSIGSGSQVNQTSIHHGVSEADLAAFFAPIMEAVTQFGGSAENQKAVLSTVQALRAEVGKGSVTDSSTVVELAQTAVNLAPNATLSNGLFAECQTALEDAYDVDSFAAMLRGRVGKRLDLLTSLKVGFSSVVSNVLLLAEYEEWTALLIDGAVVHNPTNRKLSQFSERYINAKED
jgi:hypothetical protein